MGLIRWFTKNWANTNEPTHSDLRPYEVALPVDEAMAWVKTVLEKQSRWRIESADSGQMHLTRRTRVFRFVDDVILRFEPNGPGCRIQAESRSRVGVGDLGQNRRNIFSLWSALRSSQM